MSTQDTSVSRTYNMPVPPEMSLWQPNMQGASLEDETIKYTPIRFEQNSNYNDGRVDFEAFSTDRSAYYDLKNAAIEVDFQLQQADGELVELDQQTALVSNGWALFESTQVQLGGKVVQDLHQGHPVHVSHLQNLTSKSREWVDTVGRHSHMYVDQVSDGGTGLAGYVGPHDALFTAPTAQVQPVNSFYHEVQSDKVAIAAGEYVLTRTLKNPKFDPSFKDKVDTAVLHGARGQNQKMFLKLSDVCPLLESFDKVVQGTTLKVNCQKRSRATGMLFGALADAKVEIKGFALWIPVLQPTLSAVSRFQQSIAESPRVELAYRDIHMHNEQISNPKTAGTKRIRLSEVSNPQRVVVAFRDLRRDNLTELNTLEYDLLGAGKTIGINRISLKANGVPVPAIDYLPKEDSARILHDLYRIYGKQDDPSDSCIVTTESWLKGPHSIFAFDLDSSDAQAAFESSSSVNLELVFDTDSIDIQYEVIAMTESKAKCHLDYSSGVTKMLTVR